MTQIILLNLLGLMYSGERRALEVAEIMQSLLPTLGRRKKLFINMFSLQKIMRLPLSLGQKWKIWVLDEERRRAGFAIWVSLERRNLVRSIQRLIISLGVSSSSQHMEVLHGLIPHL